MACFHENGNLREDVLRNWVKNGNSQKWKFGFEFSAKGVEMEFHFIANGLYVSVDSFELVAPSNFQRPDSERAPRVDIDCRKNEIHTPIYHEMAAL